MKKIYAKLIVIVFQLMLALSVAAMSSYAWLVLSANPAVEGIQITIGGGNTILVAADLTAAGEDGTVYHYPARFQDTLNFGQHQSYEYLKDLRELTPVSTADGLNWYLPAYYDLTDQAVQDGKKMAGDLKPIQSFTLDDRLRHANLSGEESGLAAQGSYAYLDFWVVSPGTGYTLRLSTGEDSGGSCVVGLMDVTRTADGYTLTKGEGSAENCVRVGLLVNPDDIIDNTMVYYQNSPAYNQQYTRLKGLYMEPEKGYVYSSDYRFTIYEPNGDAHVEDTLNGSYQITEPVGLVNGAVGQVDVRDRLTVQTASTWLMAGEDSQDTQIEQRFQAALAGFAEGLAEEEMASKFYNEYLGGQLSPYIDKGAFLKSTQNLYNAAAADGVAAPEYLQGQHTAGATDDVYIVKLEKDVPQRIRLFVWLEGQDGDCVNSAAASSISLRLELAGSNAEPKENAAEEGTEPTAAEGGQTEGGAATNTESEPEKAPAE